jgi:hypothetical protein
MAMICGSGCERVRDEGNEGRMAHLEEGVEVVICRGLEGACGDAVLGAREIRVLHHAGDECFDFFQALGFDGDGICEVLIQVIVTVALGKWNGEVRGGLDGVGKVPGPDVGRRKLAVGALSYTRDGISAIHKELLYGEAELVGLRALLEKMFPIFGDYDALEDGGQGDLPKVAGFVVGHDVPTPATSGEDAEDVILRAANFAGEGLDGQ